MKKENASQTRSQKKDASPNWYQGQMHVHTYWSDGRGFPEQAVEAYKQRGYDFLSITDHNRFGVDPDFWREVAEEEGSWPPKVSKAIFDTYKKRFGKDWVETRDNGENLSVRLKTFQEIKDKFEEPGKFIIMPGVEFTQTVAGCHVHLNYINLPMILPCIKDAHLIKSVSEVKTVGDLIALNVSETEKAAVDHELPFLLTMNHPFWQHYDIKPRDIIDQPEIKFLEICNDGSEFKPNPHALSYTLEKFWDIVNSFRCLNKAPLVYGIGSEDAHFFDDERINGRSGVDCAWTMVRSASLTPESLLSAMHSGDCYASTGVFLEDLEFSHSSGTLRVRVQPDQGVKYKINFITTKKGFNQDIKEIVSPAHNKISERTVPMYSDDIGLVVKSVSGTEAEYRMAPDDLYVRARIESDTPMRYIKSFSSKVKSAWTQPYCCMKNMKS